MPREVIHSPQSAPLTGERGTFPPSFDLVVGWERDIHAQVGIQTADNRHLVDYLYADAEADIGALLRTRLVQDHGMQPDDVIPGDEALGRLVLDAVTGSTAYGSSVWVSTNRDQLNRLIRHARKARDAAYGSDA